MKKYISKRALSAMLMASITIAPITLNSTTIFANELNRKTTYVEESDCDLDTGNKKKNQSSETTSGSASTAEDAWLTEGTEQYEVAKRIFEVFTQEYGTSGAFAAGTLANVRGESNFIPDVMEGGRRAGMNTPDGPAYNSAKPGEEGGGGLFQFTGYSKFSHSKWWKGRPGSDGWAVENQVDAVWGLEFGNRAVEHYFSRTGRTDFRTVEDLISTDDAALASEYFQMAYERPQHFHPERAEWAKKANAVFNKDNIKADPSKFKFDSGSSTGVSVVVGSKKEGKEDCTTSEEKSFGGAWGKDNTGDHGLGDISTFSLAFKPEDLPDQIKQYALDPESIGVKWKSMEGWETVAEVSMNQCTGLTHAVFEHLWSKGSQKMLTHGHGREVVSNLVADYGGKSSRTPQAGAAFSSDGIDPRYGHTGIVSHVFANGDILIIEQNVQGYSGEGNGETRNWNYQVVGKEKLKMDNYEFYYPDGWTVNPDAKTVS